MMVEPLVENKHEIMKESAKRLLLCAGYVPRNIKEEYTIGANGHKYRADIVGLNHEGTVEVIIEVGNLQADKLAELRYEFPLVFHIPYDSSHLFKMLRVDEESAAEPQELKKSKHLKCHRCSHEWGYYGTSKWYASCPYCKTSVKVKQ